MPVTDFAAMRRQREESESAADRSRLWQQKQAEKQATRKAKIQKAKDTQRGKVYRLPKVKKPAKVSKPQEYSNRCAPTYTPGMRQKFYETREWRELRYKAIKTLGRVCMCCGASNVEIHVDHIKPRSLHPELELSLSNLQILCRDCNIGKSNKDSTDWRARP